MLEDTFHTVSFLDIKQPIIQTDRFPDQTDMCSGFILCDYEYYGTLRYMQLLIMYVLIKIKFCFLGIKQYMSKCGEPSS